MEWWSDGVLRIRSRPAHAPSLHHSNTPSLQCSNTPSLHHSRPPTDQGWLRRARADLRAEGARRFWLGFGRGTPELRAEAYRHGRFTAEARRRLERYRILQVPTGIAWSAAALAMLVPRWLPGCGALPRTPWIGAVCLHPLPLIAGVGAALTPPVVAHELAHVIWPHLPRSLRRGFPEVLARLEARDPALTGWLDRALAGYKDHRAPNECHVRLLEYYRFGRVRLPPSLSPYYDGWIEPAPAHDGREAGPAPPA